jgi:outer membrane protein assembly factor BamB
MYFQHGYAWNFSDPSKPPKLQWDISNTLFGNFEFESVGQTANGTGVVLYHGDTVVYGINVENGKVLWTAQTSGGYNSYQGCYYDGAFYKGLIDGSFWAINASDGSIMWKYPNNMWYTNFG